MEAPRKLVLASQSPRRAELLRQAKVEFEICAADIDETLLSELSVAENAKRLALEKARIVSKLRPGTFVLGSDTIVSLSNEEVSTDNFDRLYSKIAVRVLDGWCFGKPASVEELRSMLALFSGRSHDVVTAFAILGDTGETLAAEVVTSIVSYFPLDSDELEQMVASGEGLDKAGGISIQGLSGLYLESINGSYSAVMGLPLPQVLRQLRKFKLWQLK